MNKRTFFFLFLLVALVQWGVVSEAGPGEQADPWKRNIEDLVLASKAEVGLAFKDLETGETFFIQERLAMHAASTMKVPVMIEIFRLVEQGSLSLEDGLVVRNEFRSIIDGSLFSLSAGDDSDEELYRRVGETVPLRDLVERMITLSSNLATNILIEKAGLAGIQATMSRLGAAGMKVIRCLDDMKAFEAGLNNTTDAQGLMAVMEAIAAGRAGSEASCREMTDVLSRQAFRENIPAGLPKGTPSANKTGWITRICHDAAIVFPEGRKPYVLVVLTRGIEDKGRASKLIAAISSIVYGHVTGKSR